MPKRGQGKTAAAKGTAAKVGYEAELWQMADALRGSMDAAEYKHVVLGLTLLTGISDAFDEAPARPPETEGDRGAGPGPGRVPPGHCTLSRTLLGMERP